jgi:ATP-dependent HslUV protease ATP-binding subunit HslU
MTRTDAASRRSGQEAARPARAPGDPGSTLIENLTPRQIVEHLDRYIIGQDDAKRAVAVALRNRYRRQRVPERLRAEIRPANILMIGPTGVGKTEIARRVAQLVGAPFIKVEATRFTEVGYVGKDVESIIRDLVETSVSSLHRHWVESVKAEAMQRARQRLLDLLTDQALVAGAPPAVSANGEVEAETVRKAEQTVKRRWRRERKRWERLLDGHQAEDSHVELEVDDVRETVLPAFVGDLGEGIEQVLAEVLEGMAALPRVRRRVSVREARRILEAEESDRLVDFDAVVDESLQAVETGGVVFIDELDKTIAADDSAGAEISASGVQRDLLPLLEGAMVQTRFGAVRTDHVLFIASGAFHGVRPSDLIPEMQGRFPVRVELQSLREDDYLAILTQPEHAFPRQYEALLATESVKLAFDDEALRRIAQLAAEINGRQDDIGARRLQTLLEHVLGDTLYAAPELEDRELRVTVDLVNDQVGDAVDDEDISLFIL